jgi:hypothetical protein
MRREQLQAWAKERFLADKELKTLLWERKGIILLVLAALLILFAFWAYLKVMITLAILIVIGFASLLYNRYLRISLGFELILFVTVLAGVKYGPLAAFFVGATALFAIEIFNASFQHSTFVSFTGLALVSITIPIFNDASIVVIGLSMTLLYNAILASGYLLLGSEPWKVGLFAITDILFNSWVFLFLAPKVAGLV